MADRPLPDGWTFTLSINGPTTPSLIIPAPDTNIRHVLTSLEALFLVNATGLATPVVQVIVAGVTKWSRVLVANAPAGVVDRDDFTDEGLIIPGQLGVTMTINFDRATPAGSYSYIRARGYDT